MGKLSVLYVVRNEQALIGRSLSSVVDIADEIVIIDTGSTDDTLKICRQYPKAKVYLHPWTHDFSTVRNFGISKCSMDWVLSIDADERLDRDSALTIKQATSEARGNVKGFSVRITDREESWDSSPNSSSFFPSPQVRLFRREAGIHFTGAVGESVKPSIQRKQGAINLLDAALDHWLWRGRGAEYAKSRISYYNKLGSHLPFVNPNSVLPDDVSRETTASARKVAIVVAGFNAVSLTKSCLESVLANTSAPYEVFAVDNGSSDGTGQAMAEILGTKPIMVPRNEGVAKGRNRGAAEALKDPTVGYVCFLDNDTRVSPGWLEGMLGVLQEHPNMGMVGPISAWATGPQNVAPQFQKRGWEDAHPIALGRSPRVLFAERIDGFCMLVKADVIKRIGLLESFGLYGHEADDFSRRVLSAGYEIGVANQVYVQHRGRTTMESNREDWNAILAQSSKAYSKKWSIADDKQRTQSMQSSAGIAAAEKSVSGNPRLSIVVSTKDSLDRLRDCVNSIASKTANYELVVVDNGSTDGSQEFLASRPAIRFVRNPSGKGGLSLGIKATSSEHIAILRDDSVLLSGWASDLFSRLPGKAMVGADDCLLLRRQVFEQVGLVDDELNDHHAVRDVVSRARAAGLAADISQARTRAGKDRSWGEEATADRLASRGDWEPERLEPIKKRLRIMVLAPRFDQGVKERGYSYESENLIPAIQCWGRTVEMAHFDFVEHVYKHGVPRMSEMLFEQAAAFCPDAVLMVPQDENHDPRRDTIRKISAALGAKTFGWFDSHLRCETFDKKWAPYLDFCVTTSSRAYEAYVDGGLCGKAIKTRRAASAKCRMVPGVKKDVDVCCVGLPHYDRRREIEELRAAGVAVSTPAWERRVSMDEQVGLFNRAKICLNLASVVDGMNRETSTKNLEIPACGGFLLTNVTEDLGEYFSKEEAASFSGDLAGHVKSYLANDARREAIATAGHARSAEHTWQTRLDGIFSEAGMI